MKLNIGKEFYFNKLKKNKKKQNSNKYILILGISDSNDTRLESSVDGLILHQIVI